MNRSIRVVVILWALFLWALLPVAVFSAEDRPLSKVAKQMHQVEERLRSGAVDSEVVSQQQAILDRLDQLLELNRAAATKGALGSAASSSVGQNGVIAPSSVGAGSAVEKVGQPSVGGSPSGTGVAESLAPEPIESGYAVPVLRQFWGQLPESTRQSIPKLPSETFLPGYESAIRAYYLRLLESPSRPKNQSKEVK
jgi:hypothetical protein